MEDKYVYKIYRNEECVAEFDNDVDCRKCFDLLFQGMPSLEDELYMTEALLEYDEDYESWDTLSESVIG